MSEVMAIESIVEAYAKFKGYFCEMRVPFKLRGGYSDLDIVGFNPKTRATLVVECKAWGSSDYYPSCGGSGYKRWFKEEFRRIIKKWDRFKKSPSNRWNLSKLDQIWYVLPGYSQDKEKVEAQLSKELKHSIRIIFIHELIRNVILEVNEDRKKRGKRYSNPALEFCRWLLKCHEKGKLSLIDLDSELKRKEKIRRAFAN